MKPATIAPATRGFGTGRSGLSCAGLRIGTPAGAVTTFVEDHEGVPVVGVVRTYRRLAHGTVLLPDPPLLPSVSA